MMTQSSIFFCYILSQNYFFVWYVVTLGLIILALTDDFVLSLLTHTDLLMLYFLIFPAIPCSSFSLSLFTHFSVLSAFLPSDGPMFYIQQGTRAGQTGISNIPINSDSSTLSFLIIKLFHFLRYCKFVQRVPWVFFYATERYPFWILDLIDAFF